MFFLKDLPTQKMLERYAANHPEMNIAKTQDALSLMRKASLLIRKLEAYFASHGLSQTRFLILIVLDREPDHTHLTLSDLVQRLDVSKPVITQTLKTLQADGYVSIETDLIDRRHKHVQLSDKGHHKLKEILPGYFALIDREM